MLSSIRFAVHRSAPQLIAQRSAVVAGRAYSTKFEGQPIPDVTVMEDSPGNQVSLKKEIEKVGGTAVVVGTPGAFSPACSATHVPGFIKNADKLPGPVFVVSVNDPFVMKAWKDSIEGASKVRFLGDAKGELLSALDLTFPAANIFGNDRSKRFAMFVKDNKIQVLSTEPDNTGVSEASSAEGLLKLIQNKT